MPAVDPPRSKPASDLTAYLNGQVSVPDWDTDPEQLNASKDQLVKLAPPYTVWKGEVPVWSLEPYGFLLGGDADTAPASCNPSLWRNARLNMFAGLFQVRANAVYQVRGLDLSNITFLEDPNDTSAKGKIVVVDPLVSEECAQAALDLYYSVRPRRPIGAVIYTHSHLDHYGGVGGLFGAAGPASDVLFVAPDGFLDHAVDENVFAGAAMGRRAEFMYGIVLPRGRRGQVDAGLGKGTSTGTTGIIAPNHIVKADPAHPDAPVFDTICDIKFEFQLTPNTEAPSEMNFYLPASRSLCIAENATPTLHNVYSLRGAQVRDAKAWAVFLNNTVTDFGHRTDVLFASHFWPRWTSDDPGAVTDFLSSQADLYRFLHDQAMRDANEGRTMIEVAEDLDDKLPASLAGEWFNRGYYGTTNHNLKAIYQRYLGFYDGNAAHLHVLPPEQAGRRYVKAMGGVEATLEIGVTAYDDAESVEDYRWSAEVLSHLVFGHPELPPEEGRYQLADVLEQLGYLAESAPWRNFYLCAALELRTSHEGPGAAVISPDMMDAMSVEQVCDYLGLRAKLPDPAAPLDGPVIGFTVLFPPGHNPQTQQCTVGYRNSVLLYQAGPPTRPTSATYLVSRVGLSGLALGTPLSVLEESGELKWQTGSRTALHTLMGSLATFTADFALTRP